MRKLIPVLSLSISILTSCANKGYFNYKIPESDSLTVDSAVTVDTLPYAVNEEVPESKKFTRELKDGKTSFVLQHLSA